MAPYGWIEFRRRSVCKVYDLTFFFGKRRAGGGARHSKQRGVMRWRIGSFVVPREKKAYKKS